MTLLLIFRGYTDYKLYNIVFLEMKQLEAHPVFNPSIKVVDAPHKEKKKVPVSEDKAEVGFSLFEQAAKDAPAEKGSSDFE